MFAPKMSIPDNEIFEAQRLDEREVIGLLQAAECHWHFAQGIRAIDSDLHIPGCLSLLAGIETSLRGTLFQLREPNAVPEDLGQTMSNALLRVAAAAELPVGVLAFPGESDFAEVLRSNRPNVQIVALRHDLLHGNIMRFAREFEGSLYFTPECLRETSALLRRISLGWARALSEFRADRLGL